MPPFVCQHATHLHSQHYVKPIVLSLTYTYFCAYKDSLDAIRHRNNSESTLQKNARIFICMYMCIMIYLYICAYTCNHMYTAYTERRGESLTRSEKPSKPRSPHEIPAHTREQFTKYDPKKEKAKRHPICAKGLKFPTNIPGWPRRKWVGRRTSHHSIIKVQVKKGIAMCAFCWLSKHSAHPSEDMT